MNDTITLNRAQVSDLFFNFDHPSYEALWSELRLSEEAPDQVAQFLALKDDAVPFCEMTGGQVDPEWLARDFLARV